MYGRETIEVLAPEWNPMDSTALIAESRGAVSAVRVESGKVLVTTNSEDIERVRDLMKARGLNIIEQSV